MVFDQVQRPRVSDVIMQRLEAMILEGSLKPGKNCRQSVSWQSSSVFPDLLCVRRCKSWWPGAC